MVDRIGCKDYADITDADEYLKYYLQSICFLGELRLDAIETMSLYKGQGDEYIQCSFDDTDEDYKEGYVTLYFWRPAVENDTIIWIENKKFYEALMNICNETIKKYPKTERKIEES